MIVKCPRCKERVREEDIAQHTVDACKAAGRTYILIKHGFRPFPRGNSLPGWLVKISQVHASRGAWEGEPREAQPLLPQPEVQFWYPRWVDIIVELWVGSIYHEGETRKAQRDAVLQHVLNDHALQGRIVDAYAEDLRAVRDFLRPHIVGPLPKLLSEHKEEQRRS